MALRAAIAVGLFLIVSSPAVAATDLSVRPDDFVSRFNSAASDADAHVRVASSGCSKGVCDFMTGNDVLIKGIVSQSTGMLRSVTFVLANKHDTADFLLTILTAMHAFVPDASNDEVGAATKQLFHQFNSGKDNEGKATFHAIDFDLMTMPQAGIWFTIEPARSGD